MNSPHTGSCLCDKIQFEVSGSFDGFFLCHCKHCQKDTGSAHAANLFSGNAQLKWLKGQGDVKTYTLPNTRHSKSFCSTCGSALPNLQMEGKVVVVPAGSLNTEIPIRPTAHIFCSSKASWEQDLDAIAKFATFPA